jgi:putative GTP pyrophosphokinase
MSEQRPINQEEYNEEYIREWRKMVKLYEFAVEEIHTKIRILTQEFRIFHDETPVEHIKTRVKERKSIVNKLRSKGIEPTPENAIKHLNDIAGIRIICSFTSDIYRIFDMLRQQDDIRLLHYKDYIEYPKMNGYQSLHMIVGIPVFLSNGPVEVKVEIQLRTIAMDFWASLEHKLKYKYYNDAPKHIADELKECAHIINDLDSRMLRIKYEIDNFNQEDEDD